ncbi:MAG TPA: hypothetical protein VN181_01730, partial [Thermoanaerobaculia bacterium]|nr:hypothetical protein [Thermoanaerobaculia bacterium]
KAWGAILNLFPDRVKEELANLKLNTPKLNLSGGVENADITDEGALNALSDFLGNDLPKAAFSTYRAALEKAFSLMGNNSGRISELMQYFATLQGKELQDAVREYVTVLLDSVDLQSKMAAPAWERVAEAQRRLDATPLTRMADLRGQMALAFASASKLTDVEDRVAAQKQLNDLSRQFYELSIQSQQQILTIQRGIHESIGQQLEQFKVSGIDRKKNDVEKWYASEKERMERWDPYFRDQGMKDLDRQRNERLAAVDQEKINFFYQRMEQLRTNLLAATDPQEIQRLTQQIQNYASQALGVSDSNENQQKLEQILNDVLGISDERLEAARDKIAEEDRKTADIMRQAAELFLIGAERIGGGDRPGGGGVDRPGGERDGRGGGFHQRNDGSAPSPADVNALLRERVANMIDEVGAARKAYLELMQRVLENGEGSGDGARIADRDAYRREAMDIGRAVRDALEGMTVMAYVDVTGRIDPRTGELFAGISDYTIARIQRDPDVIRRRTGG